MEKNLLEQALLALSKSDFIEASRLAQTAAGYLSRRAVSGIKDKKQQKQATQRSQTGLEVGQVKNIAQGNPYYRS